MYFHKPTLCALLFILINTSGFAQLSKVEKKLVKHIDDENDAAITLLKECVQQVWACSCEN